MFHGLHNHLDTHVNAVYPFPKLWATFADFLTRRVSQPTAGEKNNSTELIIHFPLVAEYIKDFFFFLMEIFLEMK